MELDKVTHIHGKWYDDACGTALAMELLGERWALLVVRELMFGPRRFSDLRAALPGISARVLTERLDGLERAGVLIRRRLPPPATAQVYELTPWGYSAEQVIIVLGRWAAASPLHDPTLPLSAASLMLSFRTMFDPARAGTLKLTAAITLGAEPFTVRIRKGTLTAARGLPDEGDFAVTAPTAMPVAVMVYGKAPPAALAPAGLAVTGNEALLARFVDLFHLPPKA
jgi:DNA-binding HxlR family transcriptional regulator